MLLIINIEKYKYLYVVTNYNDSMDDVLMRLEDIFYSNESDLAEEGYIVIDALLIRGNAYNRFYELPITKSRLDFSSLSVVNIPEKDEIRKLSSEQYKKNISLLDTPLLQESTKFLISQGHVV